MAYQGRCRCRSLVSDALVLASESVSRREAPVFDFVEQEGSAGVLCDVRRRLASAASRKERPQYFGKEHGQFDVQGRGKETAALLAFGRRRRRTSLDRAGRVVKTLGIDPKLAKFNLSPHVSSSTSERKRYLRGSPPAALRSCCTTLRANRSQRTTLGFRLEVPQHVRNLRWRRLSTRSTSKRTSAQIDLWSCTRSSVTRELPQHSNSLQEGRVVRSVVGTTREQHENMT